jgi:hypothetical protein
MASALRIAQFQRQDAQTTRWPPTETGLKFSPKNKYPTPSPSKNPQSIRGETRTSL